MESLLGLSRASWLGNGAGFCTPLKVGFFQILFWAPTEKIYMILWLQEEEKKKKKAFAFQACHIVQKIYDAIANESQTLWQMSRY